MRRVQWRKAQVEKIKAEVKKDLDATTSADARLSLALQRIGTARLASGDTHADLKQYVYVMSALVQHARTGGLKKAQINNLVRVAFALLRTNGVSPDHSRLSFLFGELHLVTSQIYRRSGRHWDSAWEQQIAEHVARGDALGGPGFAALSRGLRAARLGMTNMAIDHLTLAAKHPLTKAQSAQADLSIVKAFRLSGNIAAAAAHIKQLDAGNYGAAEARELKWETQFVSQQPGKQTIDTLVKMVGRDQEHHLPEYLIEAFLWSKTLPEKDDTRSMISMNYLTRRKDLRPRRLGLFFETALVIESLYDYSIPYCFRLRDLGKILGRASELVTVDKELLALAAGARWLSKSRAYELAAMTLGRYRMLSWQLTGGTSDDALGTMTDLLARHGDVHGLAPLATSGRKTA